jgi:hypothetical protein
MLVFFVDSRCTRVRVDRDRDEVNSLRTGHGATTVFPREKGGRAVAMEEHERTVGQIGAVSLINRARLKRG